MGFHVFSSLPVLAYPTRTGPSKFVGSNRRRGRLPTDYQRREHVALMKWLWIVLALWCVLIIAGFAEGEGCALLALAAPFLPFYALVYRLRRRLRRPPDWHVENALRDLRPQLRSTQPPIIKSHVLADWVVPTKVTVYLVCARELHRPDLDSHLERFTETIRRELTRRGAPEAIARQLYLKTASQEFIDRAGGFHHYIH